MLPLWLGSKEFTCSAGDLGDVGSILGQEDSLEKEMATYSSILAWKIPWIEGWAESTLSQSVGHN